MHMVYCISEFSFFVLRVYVVFGNVQQGYERAGSENITALMETCRRSEVDLHDLPQLFYSTQPYDIDWCKMVVSIILW